MSIKDKKIGFIGLGVMGKPMAINLVKAGYDVHVYDRKEENMNAVVEAGGKAASCNKELGETCDVIITMVPNSPQVKEVMLGAEGLINVMSEGNIFVDCSSINPMASKEISAELAKKGIRMLDAPVSGGEPMAIEGTLSFMVGGPQDLFDEVKPMLDVMGASVVRCGEVGAGNTTKLANQIIVACNIQACSEAFTLAQMTGVDPALVFEAIKGGLAGSNVMKAKVPMMLEGNTKPGFRIDLHIKDLNNALDAAHSVGAPVPMTAQVQEVFQWLHNNGEGSADHSAIELYYEKLTGIKLGR